MALDPLLLEILACPEDKGPLLYFPDEDALYNPRLHRRYAVQDDIPVMLVEEAETVTDEEHGRLMSKADHDGITPTFDPGQATFDPGQATFDPGQGVG
ncbi:MAG: Trm112 family protein [Acidimicrobiales bacterium]